MNHEGKKALTREQVQLLAVGRRLRLSSGHKVVIGRHERENDHLATCGVEGVLLTPIDHPGPTTLAPGEPTREEIELAARITASYSDGKSEPVVRVEVRGGGGVIEILTIEPLAREEVRMLMV